MKRYVVGAAVLIAASAGAQVRCKMPNGVWIEQRLTDSCPAGAVQAQSMVGKALPLKVPPKRASEPVVEMPAPSALPQVVEPAAVGLKSTKTPMQFDACVSLMKKTIFDVGGANTRVVVSSPDLRILRVCTNDGSVLMTCSRLDRSMVATTSPTACD